MRRGVLLGLAVLLAATTVVFSGLPGDVQAQTAPTPNADGSYTVAPDWALIPSGLNPGDKFRLLFRSSTHRNAQSTDIADYNTHVQTAAASGHAAIQPYSSTFKVVGCTSAVNAKVNTGTDSGTGEPIYWLNGVKVADNYAGFYDGTWDNQDHNNVHTEAGSNPPDNRWPYTGCGNDGTSSTTPLGNGAQVTQGNPGTGGQSLNTGTTTPNNRTNLGFYALSPVFVVRLPPPTATDVTHIEINAVVGGNVVTDDVVTVQETDGDLVFQVRHALEPESQHGIGADLTFNYYVYDDLDYRPGWHVHPGYKSVVLPAGQTSVNVTVPVRANADGHDGDNRVRIVLMAGQGYFGVKGNLTYHIQDGPDTPPNRISHKISIEPVNPGTEVTEGETARFRIRLRDPLEAGVPFTVHLKVEDSGGYVAAAHEGHKTVNFAHGQRFAFFSVPTMGDLQDEPHGRVTVSLADTNGAVPSAVSTTVSPGGRGVYVIDRNKITHFDALTPPVNRDIIPYVFTPTASRTIRDDDVGFFDRLWSPTNPSVVNIVAAAGGPEGQEAIFLITADPAPPSDLGVSVTVTATGDFGIETGTRTVIIPSEGFAALKLDTINDENDEPNGSVTLVINPDTGYTVGPFSTYTQSIVDDDEPGLVVDQMQSVDEQLPADHPRVRYSSLVASLYDKIGEQTDDQWKIFYKGRWKRVLKAFGHPEFVDHQAPAYTAAEARKMHSDGLGDIWRQIAEALDYVESYQSTPAPPPPPTPAEDPLEKYAELVGRIKMDMTDPNYRGEEHDLKRVLKTLGDPDYVNHRGGAVGVQEATNRRTRPRDNPHWEGIAEAIQYKLDFDAGTVTQPPPPPPPTPVITISGGSGITEGGSASFTISASPAPTSPITVNVGVAGSGGFGASGAATITVDGATTTYTVSTTDDNVDEADGSVTVTVQSGSGYTVGTPSSATVTVADNDDPTPVHQAPLEKYASLVKSFYDRITARHQHGDGPSGGWNKRFLKAMGHPEYVNYPQAAVTVADATRLWNHGGPGANTAWNGAVEAIQYKLDYDAAR